MPCRKQKVEYESKNKTKILPFLFAIFIQVWQRSCGHFIACCMAGELEWVVRGGGQGVMEIYPNTCIIMPPPHAQLHKHDVILKFHEFMQSLFYLFYGSGALGVLDAEGVDGKNTGGKAASIMENKLRAAAMWEQSILIRKFN